MIGGLVFFRLEGITNNFILDITLNCFGEHFLTRQ
jgi:hypothetical protein